MLYHLVSQFSCLIKKSDVLSDFTAHFKKKIGELKVVSTILKNACFKFTCCIKYKIEKVLTCQKACDYKQYEAFYNTHLN